MDRPVLLRVSLPYLKWRDGRPRWEPNARLIALGWKGEDLTRPSGEWMDLKECEAWVAQRMAAVKARATAARSAQEAGKRLAPLKVGRRAHLTLDALLTAWETHLTQTLEAEQKKGLELTLKPKSVAFYRFGAKQLREFDVTIAASPAAALSWEICADLYDRLRLAKGDHVAVGAMRSGSRCVQWARRKKLVGFNANPFYKLEMTTPKVRLRVGTPEQMKILVAAADAIDLPEIGDGIMLGLWTGQRQGDRLAFVDAGEIDGRMNFRQQKTGALVAIPPSPQLRARLDQSKARRAAAEKIFPNVVVDEERWKTFGDDGDRYRKQFQKARAAAIAGVVDDEATAVARAEHKAQRLNTEPPTVWRVAPCPELADFHDQDLRDTAVTWLARAGCDVIEICSITGHSLESAYKVMKHYLSLHSEIADRAIAKLVAWYEQKMR